MFYCAKASKKDKGEGNDHPTVKNTDAPEMIRLRGVLNRLLRQFGFKWVPA